MCNFFKLLYKLLLLKANFLDTEKQIVFSKAENFTVLFVEPHTLKADEESKEFESFDLAELEESVILIHHIRI